MFCHNQTVCLILKRLGLEIGLPLWLMPYVTADSVQKTKSVAEL